MAAIRDLAAIAQKWATVTPQRANEYRAGINSPRVSWAESAVAAADNYAVGVQEAVADSRFARGVTKAGDAKWKRGALEKGATRWGPGVQLAQDDNSKGFAPYREAIAAVTLPPRFARRDPRNIDRVRAIVDAMIATKKALG